MKIIVTGSSGNISKSLTNELVEKGHLVTVGNANRWAALKNVPRK